MSNREVERIIELLQEMLKWVKFAGAREVRTVLMNILDTEQKRLIYHLSDGERGSVEIGKTVNASDSTVRRCWDSWMRLGIVEPLSVRGGIRYKKSFEMEDFGFIIPQIKAEKKDDALEEKSATTSDVRNETGA
jgi:hypothetical protein